MKSKFFTLFVCLSLFVNIFAEEPIVTIKTIKQGKISFNLSFSSSSTGATVKIDWGNGSLKSYNIPSDRDGVNIESPNELTGTTIIKIYGQDLNIISCDNMQITELTLIGFGDNGYRGALVSCKDNILTKLDISKSPNIVNLYCDNNRLTAIDLSNNNELSYFMCNNNLLNTLDVSKNSKLIHLQCWDNKLTSLNLSKNTKLKYLYCSGNLLTVLDLSNNIELESLGCNENQLTTLLINSSFLTHISCSYNSLLTLDVTKNSALKELNCDHNQLRELNLTKNTLLKALACQNNELKSLDVSRCTALEELFCSGNHMTFSTLPQLKTQYRQYIYAPQYVSFGFLSENQVDLSSVLTAKDWTGNLQTTKYHWIAIRYGINSHIDSIMLAKNKDYREKNGVFTFLKAPQEDYYYQCIMTNAAFPELELTTNMFRPDVPIETEEVQVVGSDGKGLFEIILSAIQESKFSGKIKIKFPEGMQLDLENTSITEDFINQVNLTISYLEDNTWLLDFSEIELKNNLAIDQSAIVRIAYNVNPEVKKGNYEILLQDIDLTIGENSKIQQDELIVNASVERYGTAINSIYTSDISIYTDNFSLVINSPQSEVIDIYTSSGSKLFTGKKPVGSFTVNSLPKGLIIIKGASGWVKKFISL